MLTKSDQLGLVLASMLNGSLLGDLKI